MYKVLYIQDTHYFKIQKWSEVFFYFHFTGVQFEASNPPWLDQKSAGDCGTGGRSDIFNALWVERLDRQKQVLSTKIWQKSQLLLIIWFCLLSFSTVSRAVLKF